MAYDYLILGLYAFAYLIYSLMVAAIVFYIVIWSESRKKKMDDMDYCPDCGGTCFDKWWAPCQRCRMTGYVPKHHQKNIGGKD